MKILIVGNGGREHALLWKLKRDRPDCEYLITRGNGGTGPLARAVEVNPGDAEAVLALAREEGVDYTVVGPEVPLAAGVVDHFRSAGLDIFGPLQQAAQLESSKAFAKHLMKRHGVPSADFGVFYDRDSAEAYARELGVPCVVKASGLAAGKGAFVCTSEEQVTEALDDCFVKRAFGSAGDEVVVEEFLEGEEVSMIALTDGRKLVPLLSSQDHKRALDGDAGPNTGGMGSYAPVSLVDSPLRERVLDEIFEPTLAGLQAEGIDFTGCLYAGLMLTAEGPKVLEWNVRFGDPETQALIPLLDSDLLELLRATSQRGGLEQAAPKWKPGVAITVVAAAGGYPGAYETGAPIELPEDLEAEGVVIFHAGTGREGDQLVVAGGRVLNVTACGESIIEARERAYAALYRIGCDDLQYRTDIGWRELERVAVV